MGPVSPVSNPDLPAGDTKIITGGGSLNSTLSVGEGGNLELIKAINEVIREEIAKSIEIPAKPEEKIIPNVVDEKLV